MKKSKRNTKTKQLVMSVLEKSQTALSHEDIEQKLLEKIDRVTIYRILNGFYEDGKVHKIMSEDGKTYFSICHHCTDEMHVDNHAHFHCTKCDAITCMKEPLSFQPVPKGYNISSISTILTGICRKCNKAAIWFFFLTYSLISFAQNKDTAHILHEVVVSDYASRLQGENVANVEKLTLKETPVLGISLSDKLTNIVGLDNYSTGAGIGKPVIRGLSGNRIAVFSQGVRIENQQWGDEHGLGLDDNGYEQVEVIKGPSSLLYGSDALGGVLFFADERYAENNSIDLSLSSEFHLNTLGLRNTGAFKLSKNKFHFNLFGGYTTHRDYSDGYNNFVQNSRFNTGDIKSTFAYTGNKFITSLKYNYLNEKYGLTEIEDEHDEHEEGEEHEGEEHEDEEEYANGRKPYLPYQNLSTHLLAWENTLLLNNNSKLKFDFGYVFNNRQEFEHEHHHHEGEEHEHEGEEHEHEGEEHEHSEDEHQDAALNMNLSTFSYNVKWYSPRWDNWELITGGQGMVQTNTNYGEETLIPNAITFDIGAFAMTNFYYSEKAYLQSGIRLDNRHITTSE
ncbi:MAG: TonB-dependent receptor plug domain-containing protein, partial [Bacteroidales bacterium]|nr:TonB-dependent receptor plug domain-containing protein [Bacteroidales bacterium]